MTVATLTGTDAEAIEFTVDETSDIAGQTVRGSRFPKNAVIGAIVRGDQVIVPRGDDEVLVGDEVIVFALPDAMPEVEKLFA